MTDTLAIEPHPLATESADGAGVSIDIGAQRSCVVLKLRVPTLTGTVSVSVETSPDTAGPWQRLAVFPALTVVAARDLIVADCSQFVRVRWALTGATPSAQFRVWGFAHALYATPGDVSELTFPQEAIKSVPANIQATACLAATDEAATYLAGRFTLPLSQWTSDLTMHVAAMAGYRIMMRRGFQPQGVDELIVKGRDDAIAYLKMIATNKLYPPGFVDADTADVGTNDAFVIDTPPSQWDVIGGGPVDSTFGDLTTRN